ncbi:BTAD domain-containing putative transcriptional regulator [uncultured Streptomyces sp.]|uniref:BTAD domain-containing putative transcriptional regulator n=1 Tax=uncultured Streptomyces sp. TaxID=174707 RepID=UPI00263447D1|nr:BTAD domain-containing putative transcriptional regulator [uncultured Streptomyces sp.]
MEALQEDHRPALGGHKQRAVLGLLLLRANRVVATSELLGALWPDEARPATARKIVQNAVWALRALFSESAGQGGGARPELVTQSPGYVLRIDPESVDLHRFNRRVAEGRAALSTGRPDDAARLLGAALEEWHGPPLADLAEAGTDWPELTALSQLRLDVMEDRFEAELRSGHHHSVLSQLVFLAEEEPLRERLCGQLMLALYRCGRQAEALDVFSRVRRALVEEHGLEPSRELQQLQQHILSHDPSLAAPRATVAAPPAATPRTEPHEPAHGGPHTGAWEHADGPARNAYPEPARQTDTASGVPAAVPPPVGRALHSERRPVAVLLISASSPDVTGTSASDTGPQSRALYDAVTAVTECVEELGGEVVGSLGRISVAVFGLRTGRADASRAAVRAAVALCARLHQVPGPAWHAVVSAGEALVRHDPYDTSGPVMVVGRLVDEARALLAHVPPGDIHLSAEAAADTSDLVRLVPTDRAAVHAVAGLRSAGGGNALPDPFGSFEAELGILRSLLVRARRQDAPHLVTILGDAGVGKTRFLADFVRDIRGEAVRVVRVRGGDAARWTVCDVLRAGCGLPVSDTLDSRLGEVVRRVAGRSETAERLLRRLVSGNGYKGYPAYGADGVAATSMAEAMDAWCDLLVLIAREQPLVLCVDDVHAADEAVLVLIERLASLPQDVPLFILASARPGILRERRPFWGSGLRHSGTLTLESLPGEGPDHPLSPGRVHEPAARETTGGRRGAGMA